MNLPPDRPGSPAQAPPDPPLSFDVLHGLKKDYLRSRQSWAKRTFATPLKGTCTSMLLLLTLALVYIAVVTFSTCRANHDDCGANKQWVKGITVPPPNPDHQHQRIYPATLHTRRPHR